MSLVISVHSYTMQIDGDDVTIPKGIIAEDNDARVLARPDAWQATEGGSTPIGAAGGDNDGEYPNPEVVAVHSGAQRLAIGDIADGQLLGRVGSEIIGVDPEGGGGGGAFPTYYQYDHPAEPADGETWIRPVLGDGDTDDVYPNRYGVGMFRYSATAEVWMPISTVMLDDGGAPLGLVTVGPDGSILLARYAEGTMVAEVWIGNGQIYISDMAGGTIQIAGGNVFLKGARVEFEGAANGQMLAYDEGEGAWLPHTLSVPVGQDLAGTADNATVIGLQGRSVSDAAPADADALLWDADAGEWAPGAIAIPGPNTLFDQYSIFPTPDTIHDGENIALVLDTELSGSGILDLTTPNLPRFVEAGAYFLTFQLYDVQGCLVQFQEAQQGWTYGKDVPMGSNNEHFSMALKTLANKAWRFKVFNNSGSDRTPEMRVAILRLN